MSEQHPQWGPVDQTPPKNNRKGWLAAGAIIVMGVALGGIASAIADGDEPPAETAPVAVEEETTTEPVETTEEPTEAETTPEPTEEPADATYEETIASFQDVWDSLSAEDAATVCEEYSLTGLDGVDTTGTDPQAVEDFLDEHCAELEAEQAEASEPDVTMEQENALGTAQDYLDFMGFSKTGLIDQLEYEGYSAETAEWAVNQLDVDWMTQAERVAESYMETMSMSRSGLIDQLVFEGFTQEQAVHGAEAVGY